jgi:putative peptidoglycan lipid II flippase
LAQLYSEGRFDELNRAVNTTTKGLILLLVPISALTVAQSSPLVHFVFSHTRLHGPDFDATAATLAVFSLGMCAWGLQNFFARGFYAAQDTLTPAIVGTILTFLSLPLYWLLVRSHQHLGLALASSLGIMLYTVVLFVILSHRTRNPETADLVWFFLKVTVASALAGFACLHLTHWLGIHIGWQTTTHAFVVLVIVSTAGFLLTIIFAKLLRVREIDDYLRKVWL